MLVIALSYTAVQNKTLFVTLFSYKNNLSSKEIYTTNLLPYLLTLFSYKNNLNSKEIYTTNLLPYFILLEF